MAIGLLATGDEIVNGDVLNTNSHELAQILHSEGLIPGLQLACTDLESDIHDCIRFLSQNHSILILIGGLGPTSDDRTRFALSRFVNLPLIEFPQAIEHIQKRLLHSQIALSEGNRQQAKFPQQAELLANPNGTAMGCYLKWQEKTFILLPGPPRECLPMFTQHALPYLRKTEHSETQIVKWRVFGVSEAQIAEELDKALSHLDCVTGYRFDLPYIECKVRCTHDLIPEVTRVVEPIVKPHIISPPDKKASEQLVEFLQKNPVRVSIDDEVTGGLLQTLLLKPSNHHVLSFNREKKGDFHFKLSGLREYWEQQQQAGHSRISLHYEQTSHYETHELPYRSSLVVHLAAEWLSFRILHFINPLH